MFGEHAEALIKLVNCPLCDEAAVLSVEQFHKEENHAERDYRDADQALSGVRPGGFRDRRIGLGGVGNGAHELSKMRIYLGIIELAGLIKFSGLRQGHFAVDGLHIGVARNAELLERERGLLPLQQDGTCLQKLGACPAKIAKHLLVHLPSGHKFPFERADDIGLRLHPSQS